MVQCIEELVDILLNVAENDDTEMQHSRENIERLHLGLVSRLV